MSFQFANRLFQYFKMDPLVLKNKQVLFSFSLKRLWNTSFVEKTIVKPEVSLFGRKVFSTYKIY